MSTGRTYFCVPVESGNGLVCRIGSGKEAITSAMSYAALAVSAEPTQVIAVWQFDGELNSSQAEEIAVITRPTALLICSSPAYGTLRLDPALLADVAVLDIRP